jgi:sugar phosphate permease
VWHVLRSRNVLLLAAAAFMEYVVSYRLHFWFPIMLKRQPSLSALLVGVLGVIPYV